MLEMCTRPLDMCFGGGGGGGADELLWHMDLKPFVSGDYSIAVVQANSCLEDQGQVFTSPSATYVGVYDGHGGPEASRFITQHLFPFIHKFASEHGGLSAEVIKKAIDATEEEFMHLVKRSWPARPQIASVGSCCLVGAIANDVLYVANLGDSRAVLGRRDSTNRPNNQVVAERLSTDHNVAVEEVRKEVVALHPDDSHIVVYNHGVWRIKGIILRIKPSIHPTRSKPMRGDRSLYQSPLLPGLPDDLAIACLIRVPRVEHRKLRLVCKRWYRLLTSNFFYSLRKSLGIAEEWIYIIKRDRDGKISWHAFDPVYQLWQPLPPVPTEYSEALGFGCAVLGGCHLYLFGGKDPLKRSMRRVIYYSARTNKWYRAPDMLRRRHFFGSCVIRNRLYVAGGENEGVHRSLRSAEVYDPNKNRWSFISDMSTAMVPFIGVVYEEKWFLKGLGPHRQVMSEVYRPENDSWYPFYNGMVAGWRNPCASLNGHLYALDCKDGCKLRVYDEVSDSWSKHIDSRIHLGSSRALEAAALVPLNGKLCIVRNNMSISLVDVSKSDDLRGSSAEHLWETIAGKGQFKTLVTNLWSSLAGRNRLKSHIVHCQVLQV